MTKAHSLHVPSGSKADFKQRTLDVRTSLAEMHTNVMHDNAIALMIHHCCEAALLLRCTSSLATEQPDDRDRAFQIIALVRLSAASVVPLRIIEGGMIFGDLALRCRLGHGGNCRSLCKHR